MLREHTGTLLNKIEVVVHFFQMYALMILLTINIDFPNLWFDIKAVFDWPGKLFSIDLVGAFASINIKLKADVFQYVRFAIIMLLPLLFFLLYIKARSLNERNWIRDYVTNWKRTKRIVLVATLVAIVCVFVLGLFLDYPT
jgi:hypothetical protein